jgi:hypothetical protein
MGANINTSSLGGAIDDVWKSIRDICNLAFIFGFIYIGISTIINPDSSNAKKFLSQIIISALLINFSLFFVKFVIDISNLASSQIYTSMISGAGSISGKITQLLGVITLYNVKDGTVIANIMNGKSLWYFVMAAIFLMITAFVFLAAAILLVVRYVALIFIMVLSPILFAATIFPQTAGYAKELWSKLVHYAFFPPAYLLFTLISIKLLEGLKIGTATNKSFADAITNASGSDYTVILYFCITIGFMIGSLTLAQKMGVVGSEMALKVGKDIRQRSQKVITNTALWAPRVAARKTVGAGSYKALNKFDKWQAKDPNDQSALGKIARGAIRMTDVDRSIRGGLESGMKAKFGLEQSYKDKKEYKDEVNKRITKDRAAMVREAAIEKATKAGATPTAVEMKAMVDAIKALTTDQMKDMDINLLTREEVAVHLSTKQIDELEKTGKYSDQQITDIKDARKAGVKNIASTPIGAVMVGGHSQRAILAQRGTDEIAKMPIEVFTSPDMAPLLTPDMVEAKMKAGISTVELAAIKSNLDAEILTQNISWGLTHPGGSLPPYSKQWENWANRSTFGARMGLTI